ncbi:MAG: recombinase RecQ, partial [Mycobacteriales bacterium]
PILVGSLGERLATLGRLEWLGPLTATPGRARAPGTNSARRVQALHEAFAVSPDQARVLAGFDEAVVLLVDDLVGSGWTMALAGRALRLGGAAAVLPFALALDG